MEMPYEINIKQMTLNKDLKIINQTEFAKLCGWSKSYLSQKFSGKKPMTEHDKEIIQTSLDNLINQLQMIKEKI